MVEKPHLRYFASRQCGYFTAAQAVKAGYSKRAQCYHTQQGDWLRIDRGVYRLPDFPDTSQSELVRWVLWAQGQSEERVVAVSHDSALFFYGLQKEKPALVHLTVSSLRGQHDQTGCVLHWDVLPAQDYSRVRGLRVTTPLRTLHDLKPDLLYAGRWYSTLTQACESGLLDESAATGLGYVIVRADSRNGRDTGAMSATPGGRPHLMESSMMSALSLNKSRVDRLENVLSSVMRDERSTHRNVDRSFTLVEMLVVITVVLVLSSLLLPSLRSALESGYGTKCQSNLRQLGIGFMTYADSNSGNLPLTREGGMATWVSRIITVSSTDASLFLCPADKTSGKISYAINRNAWVIMGAGPAYEGRKRLQSFAQPSTVFLTVEVHDAIRTYLTRGDGSMVDQAGHWSFAGPWCHFTRGANYLCMDGHTEFIRTPGNTEFSWGSLPASLRYDTWAKYIAGFSVQ